MTLNVESVREHFPALASGEIFLDNPGGTQIVRESIDRMVDYLTRMNANHGGAFRTSMESDAMLEQAHSAMGDFLNADPSEVIFGTNMTTLTFGISRTIGRMLRPGDEILVTRLDHDANISPWLALEEERKAKVRWIELNEADLTLDLADAASKLSPRTRLIACGYASNAVGTVNDVRSLVAMAHSVGAWCFVDAVHFAPHGPIDVRALDCDFLVCSVYKFFGPHVGVLYGKKALLEQLPAYKVRPASNLPPGKYETGTLNHEGIAGTLGVTEYLEWLATSATGGRPPLRRRDRLVATMSAIRQYELGLQTMLIQELKAIPGLKIWGITDPRDFDWRVPTVSFTLENRHPREIAERLAEKQIFTWDGNYYALAVMEKLGLQPNGGMLRVGPVHYNTVEEVHRLVEAVGEIALHRRSN